MDTIWLNEATESEAEALLMIERAAFDAYRALLDPPSSVYRETAEIIGQKMASGTFFTAREQQQIVGLVFYQRNQDHAYLGRLSVLPAWQGRGIGRMLMNAAEQRAMQHGMPVIRLGVRVALPQLIALYTRYGYRILSEHRHPGYNHTTFVTMEKRLTD